jgi:UDP-N-acetylmuramyl pentapeptide phosphotransferase/UDP-N-acetylglucosamine-1-phosphate transferase
VPAIPPPAAALGLALVLSLFLTPLVRGAARRWGLLDRPNARSSHRQVVPRGGGLAVAVAALLAVVVFQGWWPSGPAGPVLCGAAALAALGFWDDRRGLPALLRLAAQVAVAAAVVLGAGAIERLPLPPPADLPLGLLAGPLTVLWIVAVVNFFNFLDGIDGLAAAQAVVTGGGIALAGWDPCSALLGGALAGAALGFLPFNWSPASLFLGDVGSYFLGFCLAALPLVAPTSSRPGAVLFVALSLWLFLADAAWTLGRRAVRGARWYEAHREHLYQALALRWGHGAVAAAITAGSVALTAATLAAARRGEPAWTWALVGLAALFFVAEWALARRSDPGSPVAPGPTPIGSR